MGLFVAAARIIGGPDFLKMPVGVALPPQNWWLAGGISAANCVAAYAPKGSANYAASKVNLNNPGTHDATDIVAMGWSSALGWIGDGTKGLATDIVPAADQSWSTIAKFNVGIPSSDQHIFGSIHFAGNGGRYELVVFSGGANNYFANGINGGTFSSPGTAVGSAGFAGRTCYQGGSANGATIPVESPSGEAAIFLCCSNFDGGGAFGQLVGSLSSLAVYNVTLSSNQMAALDAAMP